MKDKEYNTDVLVIGAGVAGMEASLLLASAGRKIHLVEKTSYTGGNVIKYEKVFPNMECATCMIAPKQQELLQNKNIELLRLSEVTDVNGSFGNFTVRVKKKAGYVNLQNCIGCDACFEPCPVEIDNEFEENLGKRKAIYVPCPGALPNVPVIDTENCLRFKGKECQACKEACVFDAIDFSKEDEELELKVAAIIVATGFKMFNPEKFSKYGYGKIDDVYTAFEFERIFASNGPTQGKILLKDGRPPKSAAIIHCVGREEKGYCSSVCCMYSLKFVHYLKEKLPEIEIFEFYSDLCIPGKSYQQFCEKTKPEVKLIRTTELEVSNQEKHSIVKYKTDDSEIKTLPVDMVVLAAGIEPTSDTPELAKTLSITQDEMGFFARDNSELTTVATQKQGIFIAGCAQGPKDIQDSIAQAQATVGRFLSLCSTPFKGNKNGK